MIQIIIFFLLPLFLTLIWTSWGLFLWFGLFLFLWLGLFLFLWLGFFPFLWLGFFLFLWLGFFLFFRDLWFLNIVCFNLLSLRLYRSSWNSFILILDIFLLIFVYFWIANLIWGNFRSLKIILLSRYALLSLRLY